ncbi:hypothetical protein ABZ912_23570 [Nonomuraea angiospora]|uniref:hypothetical protein n=1 Tax=Nonomuraea angiospora TaxID=46172 RepID=UPI0033E6CB1F
MSELDRYVEALFDDDADVPAGMGEVWTPELHSSVMARLRAASGPRTRTVHEYGARPAGRFASTAGSTRS